MCLNLVVFFCRADGACCIHDTPECLQSCLFVMRVFSGRRLRQVGHHSTSLSKQNYSTIPCSQHSPRHFGVFHHWRSLWAWRQNYYNPAVHLWSTTDKLTLASQNLVCIHVVAGDNVFWKSNCKMVCYTHDVWKKILILIIIQMHICNLLKALVLLTDTCCTSLPISFQIIITLHVNI